MPQRGVGAPLPVGTQELPEEWVGGTVPGEVALWGSSAGLRVGAGRSSPLPGHCRTLPSPVLRPVVGTEWPSERGSA